MAIIKFFFVCGDGSYNSIFYGPLTWKNKERGYYLAILTEQVWSIEDFLYSFQGNFSCRTKQLVSGRQNNAILPAQVANHSAAFGYNSYPHALELLMCYQGTTKKSIKIDDRKSNQSIPIDQSMHVS